MEIGGFFKRLGEKGLRVGVRGAAQVMQTFGDKVELKSSPRVNSDLPLFNDQEPFAEAPDVTLDRPVVLVPGFRSKGDCFFKWANTLTQDGQNGGRWYLMEDGDLFDSSDLNNPVLFVDPDAKVFVTRFEGNIEPPDQAGNQLGQYIDRVTEDTRHPEVDLVGYSMGGLTSRSHLDSREDPKVHSLVQLGTPNGGSEVARMALVYLEERPQEYLNFTAFEQQRVLPRDMPALQWLQSIENGNAKLEDLNSRWEQQRAKLEDFQIVGSAPTPTLAPGLRLSLGDGAVHEKSLSLPGETPVTLDRNLGLNHKELVTSVESFREAQDFFGWQIADNSSSVKPEQHETVPSSGPRMEQITLF